MLTHTEKIKVLEKKKSFLLNLNFLFLLAKKACLFPFENFKMTNKKSDFNFEKKCVDFLNISRKFWFSSYLKKILLRNLIRKNIYGHFPGTTNHHAPPLRVTWLSLPLHTHLCTHEWCHMFVIIMLYKCLIFFMATECNYIF